MVAELLGFDVSQYQDGAYAGGGGFAFGLAKLTEGVGYKDPAADRHMAALLAAGIVPGGYHFARPDLNGGTAGAQAEADWFWQVATSYGGARGMLLALDAESAGGWLQWCDDFLGRLSWRLDGYQGLFYSYWNWMQSHGVTPGSDLLGRSALWFAWPDANGPFPVGLAVSMQQYGLTSVPGIAGQVDANRFFGDLSQLRALTVGGPSMGIASAASDGDLVELHHLIQQSIFGAVDPSGQQDFVNTVRAGVPLNSIGDGWRTLPQAQAYAAAVANLVAVEGTVAHLQTGASGADPAELQAVLGKLAADQQQVLADLQAAAADPKL